MWRAKATMAAPKPELLSLVVSAQQQLTQLESVSKGLIDELAAAGAQASPQLRELLSRGTVLVAAVQKAVDHLGSTLPEGPTLPPGPSRSAIDAVWDQQQEQKQEPSLLPTPVRHPAASLVDLAASISHIPTCTLQLLEGRQPVGQPAAATAVLLRCGRTFAAAVQLQQAGGLVPLRVGLLSAAEADAALAGSGSGSLWAPSQHAVFQQLSSMAAAALRFFLQVGKQQRASTLELLLLWLATHSDLFSRRSSTSGSLLPADSGVMGSGLLPPLRRPVQLSWQELWQAALNQQLRQAEHLAEV